MPAKGKSARRPGAASRVRNVARRFGRVNTLTSLVLILPALILYQLGELLDPNAVRNGADVITGPLLGLFHHSWTSFLVYDLALLAVFAILVLWLRKKQQFELRMFAPVLLESAIYAVCMGSLIVYLMQLIGINPKLFVNAAQPLPGNPGVLARVGIALGAGVHEELVFRLAMIPAIAWVLDKLGGLPRWFAIAAAFVVSSLLFSAAHHVIGGEPWRLAPFIYRFFCGLLFATLFQFRGLAVAVYTHALYDMWVMLLR